MSDIHNMTKHVVKSFGNVVQIRFFAMLSATRSLLLTLFILRWMTYFVSSQFYSHYILGCIRNTNKWFVNMLILM